MKRRVVSASPPGPYEPFMLVLCVWVLVSLAAETFLPLAEETRQLLHVTSEGRLIAAGLMAAGVGLFGTLTAFVASWFLEPEEKKVENEIDDVRAELRAIRALLEQRSAVDQRRA
jgi:hypothetical protein